LNGGEKHGQDQQNDTKRRKPEDDVSYHSQMPPVYGFILPWWRFVKAELLTRP
jgi:hypothetical protein